MIVDYTHIITSYGTGIARQNPQLIDEANRGKLTSLVDNQMYTNYNYILARMCKLLR